MRFMLIIYNNFCCFRASAYTTLDRLCSFFYIIFEVLIKYHDVNNITALKIASDITSYGRFVVVQGLAQFIESVVMLGPNIDVL